MCAVAGALLSVTATVATPARAAVVSSVVASGLTVTGTGSDAITIGCAGTSVKVNGADPDSGSAPCASVVAITVNGGTGPNLIDLAGVTKASFPGIPITTPDGARPVEVDGATGDDTIVGSPHADTLLGFDGNDTIDGFGGDDLLGGEEGDDVLDGGDGVDSLEGGAGADRLAGGLGKDTLNGAVGNDMLNGGDADDVVRGGAGSDVIDGGPGDDMVSGEPGFVLSESVPFNEAGNDTISGGSGTDTLTEQDDVNFTLTDTQLTGLGTDALSGIEKVSLSGGTGPNTLDASAFTGVAMLVGFAGNDRLIGGSGADTLGGTTTETGDDVLTGAGGNDDLDGGAGADRVLESGDTNFVLSSAALTGLGSDTLASIEQAELKGGAGANTIDAAAFSGLSILDGAGGNDALTSGSGNDLLTGGPGDDSLTGGTGSDRVVESGDVSFTLTNGALTGLGSDTLASIEQAELKGGAGANTIDAAAFSGLSILDGAGGNDALTSGSGNDLLTGGPGDDSLTGGTGSDRVVGDAGDDALNVGEGDDTADGGDGADQINGAGGKDTLEGGAGNDILAGGLGDDMLSGSGGDDVLDGDADNDRLSGGIGSDALRGGTEADVLLGGSGNDALQGDAGSDRLDGGGNDDSVDGGEGDDQLDGGVGVDAFAGGAGNDDLMTRDETRETSITCGEGADTVTADDEDALAADCETVDKPPAPPPEAAAPRPHSVPQPAAVDPIPLLGVIRATSTRLRIGSLLPKLSQQKPGTGTALSFTLSEAAIVRFTFERIQRGRKVGRACLAGAPALRRRAPCTRYAQLRSAFEVGAKDGANRVLFHGRVTPKITLGAGRYRLTAIATDSAGQRSVARRIELTLLPRAMSS